MKRVKVLEKDLKNQKGRLEITGTLDLHGVKKEITLPVEVKIKDDKIIVDGETPLSMSDYGIKPSNMPFLKVRDKITVQFHLAGTISAP